MSFSFSLKKGKVAKPRAKPKARLNLLDSQAQEPIVHQIDGFDASRGGALAGSEAVAREKPLVIALSPRNTIQHGSTVTEQVKTTSLEPDTLESRARRSLLEDELVDTGTAIAPAGATDGAYSKDDYDTVSVDQFGAALLRGMGWDGKHSASDANSSIHRRQQGVVLGIGAKSVDKDVEAHLLHHKNLLAPLIPKNKNGE